MTRARDSRWSPNGGDCVAGSGRSPTSGGARSAIAHDFAFCAVIFLIFFALPAILGGI